MSIFSFFPSWGYVVIIVSLVFGLGAQRVQISDLKATLSQERANYANEKAQHEQLLREATENARKIENLRISKARRISDDVAKETQAIKRAASVDISNANSLREYIQLYASGGRTGNPTTIKGLNERTIILGQLLGACQAEAGIDSAELEELATQVRGLQRSYQSLLAEKTQ